MGTPIKMYHINALIVIKRFTKHGQLVTCHTNYASDVIKKYKTGP